MSAFQASAVGLDCSANSLASTPSSIGRIHIPHLDTLRFVAAAAVVGYHLGQHLGPARGPITNAAIRLLSLDGAGGTAGVRFFFVLSGFLITFLMLHERKRTGRLDIRRFYLRRALRIWPLYFAVLFVGFWLFPSLMNLLGRPYQENASLPLYALFLTNIDHILHGMPSTGILGVQWSVAIEEQFYLLWPLLFTVAGTRRAFPTIVTAMVVFSFAFKTNIATNETEAYFHSFAATGDLALGALAASICFERRHAVEQIFSRFSRQLLLELYVLGFLLIVGGGRLLHGPTGRAAGDQLTALFFLFVILEQTYAAHSFFKGGNSKVGTHLGRISYGLYLWHMVAIEAIKLAARHRTLGIGSQMLLALIITWVLAELSFRLLERPFLRLKENFVA